MNEEETKENNEMKENRICKEIMRFTEGKLCTEETKHWFNIEMGAIKNKHYFTVLHKWYKKEDGHYSPVYKDTLSNKFYIIKRDDEIDMFYKSPCNPDDLLTFDYRAIKVKKMPDVGKVDEEDTKKIDEMREKLLHPTLGRAVGSSHTTEQLNKVTKRSDDYLSSFIIAEREKRLENEEQSIRNELWQAFIDELIVDDGSMSTKDLALRLVEIVEEKLSLLVTDKTLKWDTGMFKQEHIKDCVRKAPLTKELIMKYTSNKIIATTAGELQRIMDVGNNLDHIRKKSKFRAEISDEMYLLKRVVEDIITDKNELIIMSNYVDGVWIRLEEKFREWCEDE